MDSPEHTLTDCEAWIEERANLRTSVGGDVTLPNIVGAIAASREMWRAFQLFSEKVMTGKEEAERLRQIERIGIELREMDPEVMADESDDER